jgi:hypothetical protein
MEKSILLGMEKFILLGSLFLLFSFIYEHCLLVLYNFCSKNWVTPSHLLVAALVASIDSDWLINLSKFY